MTTEATMRTSIPTSVACVALAAVVLSAPSPAVAAAQAGSAAGLTFDLGPSPVGLPANCPFGNGDGNFVYLDGNAVAHTVANANGDRGGDTSEGTAEFLIGSDPLYQGHLVIHGGGNANAKAETMQGFTLDFQGSGSVGALSIHVTFHVTTDAQGVPAAHTQLVNIRCS
jgi:hypothetical protein